MADREAMTYLTNSLIPNGSVDDYQAVTNALPEGCPDGMIARYVGMSDAGLAITVVWASKAQADRFETEQLVPTVSHLMGPPDPSCTFYSYDAVDVVFGAAEVST